MFSRSVLLTVRSGLVVGLVACANPETSQPVAVPPQPVQPPQSAQPSASPKELPSAAPAPPSKTPALVQLSPGNASCGLDAEGRVWTWNVGEMAPEVPSIRGARSIGCGMNHTCVVGADANVYCWGSNDYGALGDGTETNRKEPVRVVGLSSVAEIGVEYARACARTTTGQVYCWGDSEFGKAGDGRLPDNDGREKTTPGKPILAGAASLGVGMSHAFAVMPDGKLWCWGQNNSQSCALPATTRYAPRPIAVPQPKNVVMVRAAESRTCAIDKAGTVICWGRTDGASAPPTPVALPGPAAEVVVGGESHACARLADGSVHCWGQNDHGELGDGTTKEHATPAPVKGLPTPALGLSAGLYKTCALVVGGRVFCWGDAVTRRDRSSLPDYSAVPIEVLVDPPEKARSR